MFELLIGADVLLPISLKLVNEHVEVAVVMLGTSLAEVTTSNLCRNTDCLRSRFSWLSLSPSRQCFARTYKIDHDRFHPEPLQFSIYPSSYNSNKSPTRCNNFSVYYPAGPTTNTARLSPRYEGKTRGCHCSHRAPDDGRENARNMLSCKQTSG